MSELLYVNPDVVLRPVDGAWVASNPRLRTHVELDSAAVRALAAGTAGAADGWWAAALAGCSGGDRTRTALGENGLHADHSGLLPAAPSAASGAGLLALLRRRRVLVRSRADALELVAPLASVLDRDRLGTFHQRVGQYVMVDRRIAHPWRAWHDQKFTPDGTALRAGPYRSIQEPFFDRHFAGGSLVGRRVVDFGCGNGYFSAKFAALGAEVVGVDSSPELLAMARDNWRGSGGLSFHETRDLTEAVALCDTWPAGSVALIYLQDTLLLLLNPEAGSPSPHLPELFRAFRRLLAADGRLCAMEPNPVFWLAGRYGDPAGSYAVVTEYRHPLFGVAPTLDRVLPPLARSGFALVDLQHPYPEDGAGGETGYSSEFPSWDFMTFCPRPT
jgi:SAM-dependent methyltransferase